MPLVISRRFNQRIRIADDIWVWVGRLKWKGTITLAIDAPRDVEVVREELLPMEQRYKPPEHTHE